MHAHYLYDAAGERVVKLVRRQGGLVEITRYLAGFEHRRWATGGNNHLHVMDEARRIAFVRAGPAHPDDRGPAIAYQLTDHLGSTTATLDESGTVTNREEYTPYGETSFGSYTLKRYRYTGRERDEESGLAYHSARYYAPGQLRWANCDPIGASGGTNLYEYAADNPLRNTDRTGREPVGTYDEQGHLWVKPEIIEVTGKTPDDAYGSSVSRHIADPLPTYSQWKSRYAQDDGVRLSFTMQAIQHEIDTQMDPEATRAEADSRSQQAYHDFTEKKNQDLLENYRQIDVAMSATKKMLAAYGVAVATVAAAPVVASIVESCTGSWAGYQVSRIAMSPGKMLLATVGYGLLVPPGAPELPGPGDDLGREIRLLFTSGGAAGKNAAAISRLTDSAAFWEDLHILEQDIIRLEEAVGRPMAFRAVTRSLAEYPATEQHLGVVLQEAMKWDNQLRDPARRAFDRLLERVGRVAKDWLGTMP